MDIAVRGGESDGKEPTPPVVNDSYVRSDPFSLSLALPDRRSCDGSPEPLRLAAPAMSSDPAAARLAPMPPIDPFPPLDHTSS